MNNTSIEWTDLSWNPIEGCTKVSQGCKHCYAATIWKRFNGNRPFSDVKERPDRLKQPLLIKEPKKIFVNSMSDLFHEDVSFQYIRRVFMLMYSPGGKHHTYQVLTKRAERMLQFYEWLHDSDNVIYQHLVNNVNNIWIGVSVEDQQTADERIPKILQVPAAVRFLSCEPLLEKIDITAFESNLPLVGKIIEWRKPGKYYEGPKIHWVIAGGESGPRARPMHPQWARSLRDQCASAGVPFFFKQWGEYVSIDQPHVSDLEFKKSSLYWGNGLLAKVGKKISGNTLDGKQHLEFPKPKNL